MKSIICFGNPIADSYLLVPEGLMEKYGIKKGFLAIFDDPVPPDNLKQIAKDHQFTPFEAGGSAINTIKAYSLLGGPSGLVCSYGDDEKAELIEASLKKIGVKLYPTPYENSPTSYLMIIVTPDAQRTVLGSFYSSYQLDSKRANYDAMKDYDYVLVESYSFSEDPKYDAIHRTLEHIEKNNKGMIFALSNPICSSKFRDEMLKFIFHKNCKYVIGNESEYTTLYPQMKNLEEVAEYFNDYNNKHNQWDGVLMTQGSKGAYLVHGGKVHHIKPPKVDNVVDTTGAGDYFSAGILSALINGYGVDVAEKMGQTLAGDIISRVGVSLTEEAIKKARNILGENLTK